MSYKQKTIMILFLVFVSLIIGLNKTYEIILEKEIKKLILKHNEDKNKNIEISKIDCNGYFFNHCKFENITLKNYSYIEIPKDDNSTENTTKEYVDVTEIKEAYLEDFKTIIKALYNENYKQINFVGELKEIKKNNIEILDKNEVFTLNLMKMSQEERTKNFYKKHKWLFDKKIDIFNKIFADNEYKDFYEKNILKDSFLKFNLSFKKQEGLITNLILNDVEYNSYKTNIKIKNSIIDKIDLSNKENNIYTKMNISLFYKQKDKESVSKKHYDFLEKKIGAKDTNLYLYSLNYNKNKYSDELDRNDLYQFVENLNIKKSWKQELKEVIDNKNKSNVVFDFNNKEKDNWEAVKKEYAYQGFFITDAFVKKYNINFKTY